MKITLCLLVIVSVLLTTSCGLFRGISKSSTEYQQVKPVIPEPFPSRDETPSVFKWNF